MVVGTVAIVVAGAGVAGVVAGAGVLDDDRAVVVDRVDGLVVAAEGALVGVLTVGTTSETVVLRPTRAPATGIWSRT